MVEQRSGHDGEPHAEGDEVVHEQLLDAILELENLRLKLRRVENG